ncbi:16506_t:CDS:2, partial [Racocetra fulgida]
PAMNDLILAVFGDSNIFLDCDSGECLHYTEVPGFKFKNVGYFVGEKQILSSIHGIVKPGEVMAILGGS